MQNVMHQTQHVGHGVEFVKKKKKFLKPHYFNQFVCFTWNEEETPELLGESYDHLWLS